MYIKFQNSYQTSNDELVWIFLSQDSVDKGELAIDAINSLQWPTDLILKAAKDQITALLFGPNSPRIYLFQSKDASFYKIKNLAAEAIYATRKLSGKVTILIDNGFNNPIDLEAIAEGLWWGSQNLGLHKTSSDPAVDPWDITIIGTLESGLATEAIERGIIKGKLLQKIGALVNEPGNICTPQYLADFATQEAKDRRIKVTVHSAKEIQKEGLLAIWNVGKGSSYPPVMIELDYHPKKAVATVGLVGKGVTFDTGGVSLKDGKNMHYMKSDMGGAAAVLGTILAAADMHLPVRLVGIVPAAENHIDQLAYRPGDVIPSYSGKTIEIINTDAEGRLLLADGLSYILANYKLDHLIDLATLTGSVVQTFGYHAAALFSNADELSDALLGASHQSGEKLWPLPLWEEYQNELESSIADIRHFHNSPLAGAAVAAKFLESFINGFKSWAHLDIAPVALKETVFSKEKVGTGFGVDLLIHWLRSIQ